MALLHSSGGQPVERGRGREGPWERGRRGAPGCIWATASFTFKSFFSPSPTLVFWFVCFFGLFCFVLQKEAGAETSSFYAALLRIQPKILHCWRPMRRTFKAYDAGSTGFVGVADFRKVSPAPVWLLPLNRKQVPSASGQETAEGDPGPH